MGGLDYIDFLFVLGVNGKLPPGDSARIHFARVARTNTCAPKHEAIAMRAKGGRWKHLAPDCCVDAPRGCRRAWDDQRNCRW